VLSFPQSNTGVLSLFIADQKSATLRHSSAQAIALLRPMHTHRHRTPPLVGRSVYLDLKGMGRSVIQSREIHSTNIS